MNLGGVWVSLPLSPLRPLLERQRFNLLRNLVEQFGKTAEASDLDGEMGRRVGCQLQNLRPTSLISSALVVPGRIERCFNYPYAKTW